MLVAAGRLRGKFQPRDQSGLNQVIGNQKIMSRGRAGGWWWCRDWCDTQHRYRCIFWSPASPATNALPMFSASCCCLTSLSVALLHHGFVGQKSMKNERQSLQCPGWLKPMFALIILLFSPGFFLFASDFPSLFPLCPQTKYAYVLCQIRLCKGDYCFIGAITSSLMNIISSYPLHYPFYEVSSALVSK